MYEIVLLLHSWARWLVIIAAILAVARAWIGWLGKKDWTTVDRRAGLLFSVALDIQMLLGLVLYIFLSPTTSTAFQNMGAAMRDPVLRYWSVEHIIGMIVALILAHIGQVLAKRAATPTAKHRRAAIFFTIATLVILASIPWPSMPQGRPLFRI